MDIREFYAGCTTPKEFEAARQRLNLWMLCDIDPVTAAAWLERQAGL